MNDIDSRIIKRVNAYYREKGKPPRMVLVHPTLYRRKTLSYIRVPLLPKLRITETVELKPFSSMEIATVEIRKLDTKGQDIPELDVLGNDQWVVCLSELDVIQALVENPELLL